MNRLLGFIAAAIMAPAATGCAVSSTTLVRHDQDAAQVIYRPRLKPMQSVDDIVDGQRRGYTRTSGSGWTGGPIDSW